MRYVFLTRFVARVHVPSPTGRIVLPRSAIPETVKSSNTEERREHVVIILGGYQLWKRFITCCTSELNKIQNLCYDHHQLLYNNVPFGVTYEKIGTIQRRLAWPLHKDDTLSRSGRSTDLNIYFCSFQPCFVVLNHDIFLLLLYMADSMIRFFLSFGFETNRRRVMLLYRRLCVT